MFESLADSWSTWKTLTHLSVVTHLFYMCQLGHRLSYSLMLHCRPVYTG